MYIHEKPAAGRPATCVRWRANQCAVGQIHMYVCAHAVKRFRPRPIFFRVAEGEGIGSRNRTSRIQRYRAKPDSNKWPRPLTSRVDAWFGVLELLPHLRISWLIPRDDPLTFGAQLLCFHDEFSRDSRCAMAFAWEPVRNFKKWWGKSLFGFAKHREEVEFGKNNYAEAMPLWSVVVTRYKVETNNIEAGSWGRVPLRSRGSTARIKGMREDAINNKVTITTNNIDVYEELP